MSYFIFKKQVWVSFLVVLLAFLILILILPFSAGYKKSEGFVVSVDYGNGVEKKFWGSSSRSKTAWDTLQQANAHSFLEVNASEDFYPASIDQKENGEEGKQWVLYINNERVFASPIEVKINSGDQVLWKFE